MAILETIRLYVEKHPKAKAEEIAKALGESVGRVKSSLKVMPKKGK